jgi:hypothetical protein
MVNVDEQVELQLAGIASSGKLDDCLLPRETIEPSTEDAGTAGGQTE